MALATTTDATNAATSVSDEVEETGMLLQTNSTVFSRTEYVPLKRLTATQRASKAGGAPGPNPAANATERAQVMHMLDKADAERRERREHGVKRKDQMNLTYERIAGLIGRCPNWVAKMKRERDRQQCARVQAENGHVRTVEVPVAGLQGGFRWCRMNEDQKRMCTRIAVENPTISVAQIRERMIDQYPDLSLSDSTVWRALRGSNLQMLRAKMKDPRSQGTAAHKAEMAAFLAEQKKGMSGELGALDLFFMDETTVELNLTPARGWGTTERPALVNHAKGKTKTISVYAGLGLVSKAFDDTTWQKGEGTGNAAESRVFDATDPRGNDYLYRDGVWTRADHAPRFAIFWWLRPPARSETVLSRFLDVHDVRSHEFRVALETSLEPKTFELHPLYKVLDQNEAVDEDVLKRFMDTDYENIKDDETLAQVVWLNGIEWRQTDEDTGDLISVMSKNKKPHKVWKTREVMLRHLYDLKTLVAAAFPNHINDAKEISSRQRNPIPRTYYDQFGRSELGGVIKSQRGDQTLFLRFLQLRTEYLKRAFPSSVMMNWRDAWDSAPQHGKTDVTKNTKSFVHDWVVRELKTKGAIFLPVREPDFNPVELLFSFIKGVIRRRFPPSRGEVREDEMVHLIDEAFGEVTEDMVKGWLRYGCYPIPGETSDVLRKNPRCGYDHEVLGIEDFWLELLGMWERQNVELSASVRGRMLQHQPDAIHGVSARYATVGSALAEGIGVGDKQQVTWMVHAAPQTSASVQCWTEEQVRMSPDLQVTLRPSVVARCTTWRRQLEQRDGMVAYDKTPATARLVEALSPDAEDGHDIVLVDPDAIGLPLDTPFSVGGDRCFVRLGDGACFVPNLFEKDTDPPLLDIGGGVALCNLFELRIYPNACTVPMLNVESSAEIARQPIPLENSVELLASTAGCDVARAFFPDNFKSPAYRELSDLYRLLVEDTTGLGIFFKYSKTLSLPGPVRTIIDELNSIFDEREGLMLNLWTAAQTAHRVVDRFRSKMLPSPAISDTDMLLDAQERVFHPKTDRSRRVRIESIDTANRVLVVSCPPVAQSAVRSTPSRMRLRYSEIDSSIGENDELELGQVTTRDAKLVNRSTSKHVLVGNARVCDAVEDDPSDASRVHKGYVEQMRRSLNRTPYGTDVLDGENLVQTALSCSTVALLALDSERKRLRVLANGVTKRVTQSLHTHGAASGAFAHEVGVAVENALLRWHRRCASSADCVTADGARTDDADASSLDTSDAPPVFVITHLRSDRRANVQLKLLARGDPGERRWPGYPVEERNERNGQTIRTVDPRRTIGTESTRLVRDVHIRELRTRNHQTFINGTIHFENGDTEELTIPEDNDVHKYNEKYAAYFKGLSEQNTLRIKHALQRFKERQRFENRPDVNDQRPGAKEAVVGVFNNMPFRYAEDDDRYVSDDANHVLFDPARQTMHPSYNKTIAQYGDNEVVQVGLLDTSILRRSQVPTSYDMMLCRHEPTCARSDLNTHLFQTKDNASGDGSAQKCVYTPRIQRLKTPRTKRIHVKDLLPLKPHSLAYMLGDCRVYELYGTRAYRVQASDEDIAYNFGSTVVSRQPCVLRDGDQNRQVVLEIRRDTDSSSAEAVTVQATFVYIDSQGSSQGNNSSVPAKEGRSLLIPRRRMRKIYTDTSLLEMACICSPNAGQSLLLKKLASLDEDNYQVTPARDKYEAPIIRLL